MDEKDLKIINLLVSNARIPKTKIAKEMNVTEAAVRKRISNLEKREEILGYKAIINYKKVGLSASLTGVDVEPDKLWKVVEELKNLESVKSLWLTTGDHTIMAEIIAKSVQELSEIHQKIAEMVGVKRVCPSIITDIVK
ncbi:MAG: Lrp/AsnC family transcriptional regulator [Archaeoglobus sp.]|uniref:Lrp/AsnC family transcriptional regulator n=1 Tax=Archaeoglobus sp. TaxID=1872626 RepID=UPI001D4E40C4|nr:Lrp/AsnC family transcriptional regulator [Archaeoglobus sp.]MBO8181080.1 Lrp/AsnC family transcriptional regulator [Archaeoglobus sp.]